MTLRIKPGARLAPTLTKLRNGWKVLLRKKTRPWRHMIERTESIRTFLVPLREERPEGSRPILRTERNVLSAAALIIRSLPRREPMM